MEEMVIEQEQEQVMPSAHLDERMAKLWSEPSEHLPLRDGRSQSFEDIFRWAAKKGVWHTDAEKYVQANGVNLPSSAFTEEEDLFVDMWRHVWVQGVEKWDQSKPVHERRDPLSSK